MWMPTVSIATPSPAMRQAPLFVAPRLIAEVSGAAIRAADTPNYAVRGGSLASCGATSAKSPGDKLMFHVKHSCLESDSTSAQTFARRKGSS